MTDKNIHIEKISEQAQEGKACLTEKKHWEDRWGKTRLPAILSPDTKHPVAKEIIQVLKNCLPQKKLTVLEIGGAPGQLLAYFAKYHNYEAHAIDYSNVGCQKMKENFDILGLDITIYKRNFFEDLSDLPRFDIVFSMGFIEHFNDVNDVVSKHVTLLKKNGILVLGVPNFRGISKTVLSHLAPHKLSMHNLSAMDIRNWASFESEFSLQPLFKGYIGGFQPKNFRKIENRSLKNYVIRLFFKMVRALVTDPLPFLSKYNSPNWSAYLLGVYKLQG